jgi:LVIVD repeat-containing protein
MNKQQLVRLFAVSTVALPGLLLGASTASAQLASDGFPASVPKAICGPGDHTESGLQGETTVEERFSGDSERAYNCNLELVGEEPQDRYQGAYSQDGPAYSGHCAYYGTDRGATTGQGIKVIDVSDPQHPVVSTQLTDTAAALAPHETVHVQGGLLVAGQTTGPNFAVYDVSGDCAHPVLKGSINAASSAFHHMGDFAPDGKTFYASQNGGGASLYIFDVSDPAHPQALPPWTFLGDGQPHSLNLIPDGFLPDWLGGTLAFVGQSGSFPFTAKADGLVVEDVSDYQFRRPNPQIRIVSKLFWPDQGGAESMIPVKINGHPYIISTDESGGASGVGGWAAACARGASPFGYPQIIDIADVRNPKIVSKLRLQVNDPANCAALLAETPPDVPGTAPGTNLPAISGTTNYSEEACVPDNPNNAKMLACAFQNAQLRIFDISDLTHPKEIAYWKSGAVRTRVLPSSGSWAPGVDRTVDKIAHWVRWVVVPKGNGNGKGNGVGGGPGNSADIQLWTVSDGHGFQVLQFTKSFTAQHKDLFENTVTTEGSL